jgi:iron complex transport system substrate-binding protein
VSALVVSACGGAQQRGGQDSDRSWPSRIISMIPATTEMLFAMGAGNRVIAVSSFDRYPPDVETLAKVGGLLDPAIERILAMKPDLVILYDTQQDLKQELTRAGIPTFNYKHQGLPDIMTTLRALGERVGAQETAESAASAIEQNLKSIKDRVATRPAPRTLLVFGREPGTLRSIQASGGYGFLHDLVEVAGGADVLADIRQQSVQMSTEMILTRAPEVLIQLHYGAEMPASRVEEERRVWSGLPALPAVKNNRVYVLFGDEFVVPGPRIAQAAERLARTLHPDLFP